jgi:hypothetical protein
MQNKKLYIVIALILVVGVVIFWMFRSKGPFIVPGEEEIETETLSEQPDQLAFNEYFTRLYLGKIPAGVAFDPAKIVKTNIFVAGEQFCTIMDMKKQVPAGKLSSAVYNREAADYASSRGAGFPQTLGPGNSTGCEDLGFAPGKYEFKIYLDDTLISVLPFDVN